MGRRSCFQKARVAAGAGGVPPTARDLPAWLPDVSARSPDVSGGLPVMSGGAPDTSRAFPVTSGGVPDMSGRLADTSGDGAGMTARAADAPARGTLGEEASAPDSAGTGAPCTRATDTVFRARPGCFNGWVARIRRTLPEASHRRLARTTEAPPPDLIQGAELLNGPGPSKPPATTPSQTRSVPEERPRGRGRRRCG